MGESIELFMWRDAAPVVPLGAVVQTSDFHNLFI